MLTRVKDGTLMPSRIQQSLLVPGTVLGLLRSGLGRLVVMRRLVVEIILTIMGGIVVIIKTLRFELDTRMLVIAVDTTLMAEAAAGAAATTAAIVTLGAMFVMMARKLAILPAQSRNAPDHHQDQILTCEATDIFPPRLVIPYNKPGGWMNVCERQT